MASGEPATRTDGRSCGAGCLKIAAIDSWQWPDERKRKACDLVVENVGSVAVLASEAARIVEELAILREAEAKQLSCELDKIWNGKN